MIRRFAIAVCALALVGSMTAACTPAISYQGYQSIDAKPQDVKVGTDTKDTVRASLGTPSIVSTFDPNVWFYISQVSQREAFYKGRTVRRDVVAISFDKESQAVAKVNTLSLKDGRVIAFNGRETPTRGRQLSILEQLLGNLGQGQLGNNEDINPGTRPGGPGGPGGR
jgi:outer membrane protein assembly factor BamE (lipoprotein component of BamABCDE complex)